jgi:isoquinoline 1-oxidoreductase beta subunit
MDFGWTINPDIIKAQTEGGIVYGRIAVLKGEIPIQAGRVEQSHFENYPMLHRNEMPDVEVCVVPSTEPPGAPGEPGTSPITSAVINAIFAATGKRIRKLPIWAEELRTAWGGTNVR